MGWTIQRKDGASTLRTAQVNDDDDDDDEKEERSQEEEGRKWFIQRRTEHILFTVIWRQTYG